MSTVESSQHSMSLSDLASRIDQALKLADASEQWPSISRVHSKNLETFHHFVTTVSKYHCGPKASVEVSGGDMVRVAFTVCTVILMSTFRLP